MKTSAVACALILGLGLVGVRAGDPPGIPWRPFPELPSVLWFQNFDQGAHNSSGQLVDAPKSAEVPPVAGQPQAVAQAKGLVASGKAVSFTEAQLAGTLQKVSVCTINISATKLKVPDGLKTTDIIFYAQFWAEDAGNITLTFVTKDGPRETRRLIPSAKTWTPVTFEFSDLAGRGGKMKLTDVVTEIRFMFHPKTSPTFQKVYVENILLTHGLKKVDEVLPFLDIALKKSHEMDRVAAQHGFTYSEAAADLLRTSLKGDPAKRKNRSVLVFEPARGAEAALQKSLMKVASKAQFSAKLVPATSPDQEPVGGLDDMRALFRYNYANNDTEFVLLAFSAADAQRGSAATESVKILIDRAFEAGCIPVVCLPADSGADKSRSDAFAGAVRSVCTAKGVTVVEKVAGAKDANAAREPETDGLALLCAKALKHLEVYYLRRK